MSNNLSSEMKVELLKLASQIVMANGDVKTAGGAYHAACQLGISDKLQEETFLNVLDAVYEHLLAKVNE